MSDREREKEARERRPAAAESETKVAPVVEALTLKRGNRKAEGNMVKKTRKQIASAVPKQRIPWRAEPQPQEAGE